MSGIRLFAVLGLIMVWASFGCSSYKDDGEGQQQNDESSHFSMTTFVDSVLLQDCPPKFQKRISVDDHTDTVVITREDVLAEISFLRMYDINKASFLGKYSIVHEQGPGNTKSVTYKALEQELPVRSITVIQLDEGKVDTLELERRTMGILREDYVHVYINECKVVVNRKYQNLFGKQHNMSVEYIIFDSE